MHDQSKNSKPSTSSDTSSSTPSPASAAGHSLYDLLDGPSTPPSGQEVARASRSRRRVKAGGSPTNATSGPSSCASSPSAALQSSLESKLRARLEGLGSPEYALIWKLWDTESGPPICALRASGRRISANDSTGWQTPRVSRGGYTRDKGEKGAERLTLEGEAVTITGWPKTPQASDGDGDGDGGVMEIRPGTTGKYKLRDYAMTAMGWTTPMAHDDRPRGKGQKAKHGTKHGCADLNADAMTAGLPMSGWRSPNAQNVKNADDPAARLAQGHTLNLQDQVQTALGWTPVSGMTQGSSPVPMGLRVALDAAFSRWLMGYLESWCQASPGFENWLALQVETAAVASRATATQ